MDFAQKLNLGMLMASLDATVAEETELRAFLGLEI